jgi:hypothetical protein
MIERRQVDGLQLPGGSTGDPDLVADGQFLGREITDERRDEVLGDAEDLGGGGDQDVLREIAVTVVGRLGQGAGEARLDPLGAVGRDADRRGDRVGSLEADPPDVRRQPVRRMISRAASLAGIVIRLRGKPVEYEIFDGRHIV